MREDYDRFVERDAEILIIGPEGPRRFKQVWEAERYPFVGFADYRHTVADRYGQEVNLLKLGRMPALLVVDKRGVIRFAHFGDDMADIPKNEDVLALLDRLNQEEVAQ
ncbi:MAG: redoxin domain-containing protein [Anaerolineae bacterium]|nr:redoxin domain-containing protein [Anaerolineae bacterium]